MGERSAESFFNPQLFTAIFHCKNICNITVNKKRIVNIHKSSKVLDAENEKNSLEAAFGARKMCENKYFCVHFERRKKENYFC